jgi:uncharacterized protein YukE
MPNDGDHINVSLERLRENAGYFHQASQDTFDLVDSLTGTARQLINDMYAELHHSPAALDRLCNRWYNATTSLGDALQEVAQNLNTAADNYQNTDKNGMPSK